MDVASGDRGPVVVTKQMTELLARKKDQWITYADLVLDILHPAQRQDSHFVKVTKGLLLQQINARYDARTDSFMYRPPFNVSNEDELIMYLRSQGHAGGLDAGKLKEGWDCAFEGITDLEAKRKLIVLRAKRDGAAKKVWIDDPVLHTTLDDEFRDMWFQTSIPEGNKVGEELEKLHYKSVARPSGPLLAPKVEKKKKTMRTNVKKTNTHMQGMFKDYSSRRPNASK